MKKFLALLLSAALLLCLAACGNAKMSDKQTLACDTADLVINDLFDELGEENGTVKTERKMIGNTAIYIIRMTLEVSEISQEVVEIFQDVIVEEAELYVSPADVYVVAYYCNQYGDQ